jgi:hypothetical protein
MNISPDDATLTPEEFFAWVPGQEGRYELVEGEVVMMAGVPDAATTPSSSI